MHIACGPRHIARINEENDGRRRIGPGIDPPERMKRDNLLALSVIEQSKIPTVHPGDWLSRPIRNRDIEMDQTLWLIRRDRGMRGERSDLRRGRRTPARAIWLRPNSGLLRENRRLHTKDKRQKKAVPCTHTLH
jgi:hypothetical protein